ncbi:MAG TPA: phosphatidylglycerol lysyltransferase domain-containing protein [Bacillota bacterium]|nr:phosphatidylglycerol lysyltransferase domain-containing protein [Bacillota bacterium]
MNSLMGLSSDNLKLGNWEFQEIKLEDIKLYSEYIHATEYPANLWSSNFAYLWASSRSSLRKVLWKIVDGMLVTFGHSYKNTLYLFCLPFGPGNPEKLMNVVFRCLKYCKDWNQGENYRTMVRMMNHNQMEFLYMNSEFDHRFRRVTLQGIERHLDVKRLVMLTGKDFGAIRNKINKFHRENPGAAIRKYRKTDYDELLKLGKHWDSVEGQKYANIFDKAYYREMIDHYSELNQIILVVEQGEEIIGMVSGGELPTGQAWGSLLKYKAGIPGLTELLSIEFIREIHKINPNIELLNIGSDLGPGGLRDYKLKFRPALNLKRYQLYLRES